MKGAWYSVFSPVQLCHWIALHCIAFYCSVPLVLGRRFIKRLPPCHPAPSNPWFLVLWYFWAFFRQSLPGGDSGNFFFFDVFWPFRRLMSNAMLRSLHTMSSGARHAIQPHATPGPWPPFYKKVTAMPSSPIPPLVLGTVIFLGLFSPESPWVKLWPFFFFHVFRPFWRLISQNHYATWHIFFINF